MTAGSAAAAGPAFSPGWFADKRAPQAQAAATGRLPGGGIAGIPNAQREQQRSQEQLQRSLVNLNRTAAMIAAQQSAQAAAHQAALNSASAVPDGMAEGGLKVDRNPLTAGWENAKALTDKSQAQVNGRTVVTVEQTGERAILNWETFNVGRQTTVAFKQEASWAVLNRVNDPKARPSQIQADRRGWHGHGRESERHRVQRHQPGQYPQPGRRRGGHERCAVQAGHLQREGGQRGPGADDAGLRQRSGRRRRRRDVQQGDGRRARGSRRAHTDGKPESVTRAAATCCSWGGRRTMPVRSRRRAARRCWPPETASSSARDWRPTPTTYRRPVATRCPRAAGPTVKQGWWRIRD